MTQIDTQAPPQDISHLLRSFEQVMDQNRHLLEDMTHMARTESLRFANRRLQRTAQALENLEEAHGVSALLGRQQEWLQTMMQDYAEQSMRYARMMSALSTNALNAARDAAVKPVAMTGEAAHAAEDRMAPQHAEPGHDDTSQNAGQPDENGFVQAPLHVH